MSTIIKLTPEQIPQVWEIIKLCVVKIGWVPQERLSHYCVWLLHKLMSGKAQCWVLLNDDRILLNISVTMITTDHATGDTHLNIEGFYAFQSTTPTSMARQFDLYKMVARQAGCNRVVASSANPRACEILEQHGFVVGRRSYSLEV